MSGGASSEPTGEAIPEFLPGEGDCTIHDTDGVLSIEWRGDESMRWVRVSRPLIEQWVKDANENRRLRVAAGILQKLLDSAALTIEWAQDFGGFTDEQIAYLAAVTDGDEEPA